MSSPGLLAMAVLAGEDLGLDIAVSVKHRSLVAVGPELALRAWAAAAQGLLLVHRSAQPQPLH